MASAHLEALNARHAQLDGMISAEMSRPLPDPARLSSLKRQKLKLKEEIQKQPN
jgi:hypothetical protein